MALYVYAVTLLVSSSLIFIVQPMVAKLVLPHLGGTSAVWTTCMLFFQAALLAGYGYAHLTANKLKHRHQVILHLILMLVAVVALPFAIRDPGFDASTYPTTWLLFVLATSVGLPFFVVSASAPLLQHWFATTDHPDREDPYHLYSASNVGSMAALLGYPLIMEPLIGVRSQTVTWAVGFVVLIVCFFVSSRFSGRREMSSSGGEIEVKPLTWTRRGKWVLWAFIPSSLMLGLTHYITTDLASLPLLWIAPLAMYLFSFIVAFAKRRVRFGGVFRIVLPLLMLGVFALNTLKPPISILVVVHILVFFFAAWFFHSELAEDRPEPKHLTQFFLIMSFGGVLGGLFNAVITPIIFVRAIDYIFVIGVAVMCVTRSGVNKAYPWMTSVLFGLAGFGYLGMIGMFTLKPNVYLLVAGIASIAIVVGGAIWPKRATMFLALAVFVGLESEYRTPGLVEAERSFFGAYKVYNRENRGHPYRSFSHGTTSHGTQSLEPQYRTDPLSYHHPSGPVGQTLRAVPHEKIMVLGLGAGAMAAYGTNDKIEVKLLEIDPVVEKLARKHFTYLEDCGDLCSVAIGDGRQLMKEEPDGEYDIIMLDAYNSDSVPTHLLSREAVQLYIQKLKPNGVLLFNVSNRHLSIERIVGAIAKDLGLATRAQTHFPTEELRKRKVEITAYTVVARTDADLGTLATDPQWRETKVLPSVWTDDYSSLIGVFR